MRRQSPRFQFRCHDLRELQGLFQEERVGKEGRIRCHWYIILVPFQVRSLHFQELRCPFENKCEITQVTRRFCQVFCICLALTYMLLLEFKIDLRCFSALSVEEMFRCWYEERKHFEPSRETGEETEDRGKQTEKAANATSSFSKQW